MTDTLVRPVPPPPRETPALRPLLLDAASAAAGAAVRGLLLAGVVCCLVWWAEDRSGTDLLDVGRTAGQVWLVAHGSWFALPEGHFGLTPLGLAVLPLLLCRRAGRRLAAVRGPARPGVLAVSLALPYAAGAVAVALACEGGPLRPLPVVAGAAAFVVAAAGALSGVLADARTGSLDRLPARVRRALPAGAAAAAAVLAAGALLALVALLLDAGTATELAEATEPGAVGGLGLLLVGAALVPNAVVWSACWLAGPGFAVGVGTSATPFGTELAAVPGLPLLAALPGGPPPGFAVLALVVPVLAGAVAGVVLQRRRPPATWAAMAGDAVAAAAAAGLLLGVLAALAGGPLGGRHLAAVGPSALPVAAAFAVEVCLGALLALGVLRHRAAAG